MAPKQPFFRMLHKARRKTIFVGLGATYARFLRPGRIPNDIARGREIERRISSTVEQHTAICMAVDSAVDSREYSADGAL